MATIPDGPWRVTLGNSLNNWANGSLVNASGTWKYKSVAVTGFDPNNPNDVSWTVILNHSNNDCTLVFTGGVQSGTSMTNGTVSGACLNSGVAGDPEDTWTAAEGNTEEASAKTY